MSAQLDEILEVDAPVYFNVRIYLRDDNDAFALGITKQLIEVAMHKRYNNSSGLVDMAIEQEKLFFIMELLSNAESKVPFFFFGKVKYFEIEHDGGKVVLTGRFNDPAIEECIEFLDSKNVKYTWRFE